MFRLIFTALLSLTTLVSGALNVVGSDDAYEMARRLFPEESGFYILGAFLGDPPLPLSSPPSSGLYNTNPWGLHRGVVLTTGNPTDTIPNRDDDLVDSKIFSTTTPGQQYSECNRRGGKDASILTVDIRSFDTPESHRGLRFRYIFTTEERAWTTKPVTPFNDAFGIYIDGSSVVDVSVNSVPAASWIEPPASASSFAGSTPIWHSEARLTTTVQHRVEFIVCDVGDQLYDTAVFLAPTRDCGSCGGIRRVVEEVGGSEKEVKLVTDFKMPAETPKRTKN